MKIAILGGLGIEHKSFYCNDLCTHKISMGGSGWLCALTARALSQEATIFSRIGADVDGEYIQKVLSRNSIQFCGSIKGKTQHFYSSILNGDATSYLAEEKNAQFKDIEMFIDDMYAHNILLLAYNAPEIIDFFCKHETLGSPLKIANLSESIINYSQQFGINKLQGFNVVTLNNHELEKLSDVFERPQNDIIKILSCNNKYVFVTSKSKISYCIGTKLFTYDFDVLPEAKDAIGAGDAFATTLAIMLYHSKNPQYAIKKAVNCSKKMCMLRNKSKIQLGEWL